jgi:hypothetical protein
MSQHGLIPPDHPDAPKYWMYETGGKLVPAMERYLKGEPAEPDDVNLIRAYLRQWIDSPVWDDGVDLGIPADPIEGVTLDDLRRKVREIRTRLDIDVWLADALDLAIDPL